MSSKFLVLATAAGCIAAAGVGSYLAVRSAPAGEAASLASLPTTVVAAEEREAPAGRPQSRVQEPPARVAPRHAPLAARPADKPGQAQPNAREAAPVQVADAGPALAEPAPAAEAVQAETPGGDVTWPAVETATTASASVPAFEDVVVAADAVLGIRIDTPVSSATSRVEDRVNGWLTRDVTVEGRTVIPAGAEIVGHVSLVEPGGRLRERARLGVKFTTIVLDGRLRIPIQTDTIYREGDPPANEATAKIGASAVIGGIIGGVFGGKRGAAIGSAAGAAGGTAVVMTGGRNDAVLPAGANVTLRLSAPMTVQVEKR